ncbi:hypothetical protein OAI37_06475 [Flavobacteriaceae bacterium]|nr:hypothetical protein [Flavobacteriaceae bacterium]
MKTIYFLIGICTILSSCSGEETIIYQIQNEEQEQEVIATCSDGIQNGEETAIDCGGNCAPCTISISLEGKAQKGPFINGSAILVTELDDNFNATGKVFTTEILDNTGSFAINNLNLVSQNISLRVDGFYFNEVCGEQSNAPITLQGISALENTTTVNLNVLTHLEKRRTQYLIENGTSFIQAKFQAQGEILDILNINFGEGIDYSERLDISGSTQGDAILIAVSSIFQGFRTESEFSSIMADFISDITTDGTLDNSAIGSNLLAHAKLLDVAAITSYIEDRYSNLGIEVVVPDFGIYIDNFIASTSFEDTDTVISYEENGVNGINILSKELSSITSNSFVSLAADLPVDCIGLKIKISATNGTNCPIGCWAYDVSSVQNWSTGVYNQAQNTQEFISTDTNTDLAMIFENGVYLIEYFENNIENPTASKILTVN